MFAGEGSPQLNTQRVYEAAPGRVWVGYKLNSDGDPMITHSKIMIVDDVYAMVGSANFSNRSMKTDDEELGIAWLDHSGKAAGDLRKSLWAEHLRLDSHELQSLNKPTGRELFGVWKSAQSHLEEWDLST